MVTGHVGKPSKTKGYNTLILEYDHRPDGTRDRRERRVIRPNGDDGTLQPFTEEEANEFLADTLAELRLGIYVEPSAITVSVWLDRWYCERQGDWEVKTRWAYRGAIDHHITPRIGGLSVTAVRPVHIRTLFRDLAREGRRDRRGGLSSSSLRLVRAVLRQAWAELLEADLVTRDVMVSVRGKKMPKGVKPREERRPLDPEGIALFLAAIGARRDVYELLGAYLLLSGKRLGEALGLKRPNVDRRNRVIHVREKLLKEGRLEVIDEPKTASGVRDLPFADLMDDLLAAVYRRQAEDRLRLGPLYRDRGLVFCQPNGNLLVPCTVRRHFAALGERIGRPWLRPHNLRHTYVTEQLRHASLRTVQALAGHADPATTLKYAHDQQGDKEAAVANFEAALGRELGGKSKTPAGHPG